MGVDLRQVVAGILTITMFVMLGQMLHRDYYDSLQVSSLPTTFVFQADLIHLISCTFLICALKGFLEKQNFPFLDKNVDLHESSQESTVKSFS